MGFSRQEYWSGLPFPPPGDLPRPGIEPASNVSHALACILCHCATWEASTNVLRFHQLVYPDAKKAGKVTSGLQRVKEAPSSFTKEFKKKGWDHYFVLSGLYICILTGSPIS